MSVNNFLSVVFCLCSVVFAVTVNAAVDSGDGVTFGIGEVEQMVKDSRVARVKNAWVEGENYDYATGKISLRTTDISIPGNFDIPVELTRVLPTDETSETGGPGGWVWDIPYIRGAVPYTKQPAHYYEWDNESSWYHGKNCTGSSVQFSYNNKYYYGINHFWQGKYLHIPNTTDDLLLINSAGQQVTKSNYKVVECLQNPNGQEGFVVLSPNGFKYTFNQVRTYYNRANDIGKFVGPAKTRLIMATRIEDRFGNYVTYNYDSYGEMKSIIASDGRRIDIEYDQIGSEDFVGLSGRRAVKATANGREWIYEHGDGGYWLTKAILPDQTSWKYHKDLYHLIPDSDSIKASNRYEGRFICEDWGNNSEIKSTYFLTPEGYKVKYGFKAVYHGRTNVYIGLNELIDPFYMTPPIPWVATDINCTITGSLVEREVSGPGVETAVWEYEYSENPGEYWDFSSWDIDDYDDGEVNQMNIPKPEPIRASYGELPPIITNPLNYRSVKITGPKKIEISYVDRRFESITENQVIAVDVFDKDSEVLLKRSEFTYKKIGEEVGKLANDNYHKNRNKLYYRIRPELAKESYYYDDGEDVFNQKYSYFDEFGFLKISEVSNNFSDWKEYQKYTYTNDENLWVLGLPHEKFVSDDGVSYSEVDKIEYYSATSSYPLLPYQVYLNGSAQKKYVKYHANGLAYRVEQNGTWTDYSDYKRGVAQTITKPMSEGSGFKYQYTTVDDNGWQKKISDFEGNCADLDYNGVGKIRKIDYCDSKWHDINISYQHTVSSEGFVDVEAGMEKITTQRGDLFEVAYYNAVGKEVFNYSLDSTFPSDKRYKRKAYDYLGRTTFAGREANSSNSLGGVTYEYDALGRLLNTKDTDFNYVTKNTYASGNKITHKNGRGQPTTTSYLRLVSGEPGLPSEIENPDFVTTSIIYNRFGLAEEITQAGVTEYRSYDDHQRLCKTSRIDVGAKLYEYQVNNLLSWEASVGYHDTAPKGCDYSVSSENKIRYYYDNLGNISKKSFGNGSSVISYGYDKNSRVKVSSLTPGPTRKYKYTSLGAVEQEILNIEGSEISLDYNIDAYGYIEAITYPDGTKYNYAPDARGGVRAITSVFDGRLNTADKIISEVSYSANGDLRSLIFGNGIARTIVRDELFRPKSITDKNGGTTNVNLNYTYDANSNVRSIIDPVMPAYSIYSMTYDPMDRFLTALSSSSAYGSMSVLYDDLGNIKSYSNSRRSLSYEYGQNTNRLERVSSNVPFNDSSLDKSFLYDEKGNTTSSGDLTLEYNLQNRVIRAGEEYYEYDANGMRFKKISGGITTYYLYGINGKLLYETSGEWQSNYIYLGNALVSKVTRKLSPLYRIQNYWARDWFLNMENQGVEAGPILPGWNSALWSVHGYSVGSSFGYYFKNYHRSQSTLCSIGSDVNACFGTMPESIWDNVEPVEGLQDTVYGGHVFRLKKSSDPYAALNVENGLRYSYAPSGWWSAFWIFQEVDKSTTYIHGDLLGSVVARSNESGDIISRHHYMPFGEALDLPLESELGYTGHLYDADTGLNYAGARYYDPVIGRFLSNDPVDFLGHLQRGNSPAHGFNRYAYVNNNPYKYNDPDGEFIQVLVGAAIGAAMDAAIQYAVTGEVDLGEVAVAAAAGAAGVGIAKNIGKAARLFSKGRKGKEVTESGLRGAQNPKVAEAAAKGRQMHKDYDYGPGFEKEVTLPSGKRADAVNWETREVVELKPNNPNAIRRGEKQVEGYRQELQCTTGECWTSRVETYE
ncbi:Rhs family protein [Teredinibacter turnerae T7901]|uniref:Rhs family protein n=1 Tax=Teredinibacter turnerae (strain ATCC 39867 / T7901) TaxID=377629 RepID=C5BI71_TERTT|nr:RHS repeat-associated core domain-containing protein [Teredinibacter turnerae]ACR13961.1 Rhs family protein [Teredinibacter turnerae T7901]